MPFDKQPCSSALTACASALTLRPCGMVDWTGTWLIALLEPPTTASTPIIGPSTNWICCWQRTDGVGEDETEDLKTPAPTFRAIHIITPATQVKMWGRNHRRGSLHKYTREQKGLSHASPFFVWDWYEILNKYNTLPSSSSLVACSWDHHETRWPLKGQLSIISSEGGETYNSYVHSSQ